VTDDGPRPAIDTLGHATGVLAVLVRRARRLASVQKAISRIVPPSLARAIQVTGCSAGELRIQVTNAAVATHLRYRQGQLVSELSAMLDMPLERLVLRVRPEDAGPAQGPLRQGRGISPRAADLLAELAAGESDPSLRQALERLARRRSPEGL
jgi:hypothetical protein